MAMPRVKRLVVLWLGFSVLASLFYGVVDVLFPGEGGTPLWVMVLAFFLLGGPLWAFWMDWLMRRRMEKARAYEAEEALPD